MIVMRRNVLLLFLMFIIISPDQAVPSWYTGKVSRVVLIGSELGDDRLKHTYTMAFTSLTTKVTMGAVINKDINGVGGQCRATGMTADLRS